MTLDTQTGPSSNEILSRIETARAPEPEAPTEEVSEQPEEAVSEELTASPDELEQPQTPEESLEEIYDFNGREISLNQILEWEKGHLMQSDYTRKTQALADERKAFESEKESILEKKSKLDEQIAAMEVYVSEFDSQTFDGMTLEELRDIDPGQYLKQKELQDKRKAAIAKAKEQVSGLDDKAERDKQVQAELIQNHPEWLEDGKVTEAYQQDTKRALDYMVAKGFTEEDQAQIKSARVWEAILDASKAGQKIDAVEVAKKKVKKAPVVTKPGGKAKTSSQSAVEKAQAAHKKHGTVETARALAKARRLASSN